MLNFQHFLAWLRQMQYNMLTSKAIKRICYSLYFKFPVFYRKKYCRLAVIYEFYIRPHLSLLHTCVLLHFSNPLDDYTQKSTRYEKVVKQQIFSHVDDFTGLEPISFSRHTYLSWLVVVYLKDFFWFDILLKLLGGRKMYLR